MPRKHLKTTAITISWTIQQLINNPDLRIFITNERLENSKSFLREIKTHFEKNDYFRGLYGNLVNEESKWTETQIIIKTRKKVFKEPTVQAGSVDTSLVSQHYDIIICDDLVSRNNTNTKEQLDKVKQYWRDLISLAEEDAIMLNIGTRWHFDDLHGYLIEQNEARNNFNQMIKSCWADPVKKIPLFPQKFTVDNLTDILGEIGSYDFSCLYLNDPADDTNADFKRSWFEKRFEEKELERRLLNTFITLDNAPSKKLGTDWIGIVVNSVDTQNHWYFRWVERFKGNSKELIDKLFQLHAFWKPVIIGVEQKAFEDLIKPFLDDEMRRRRIFFTIEELKDRGVRKEIRIRGRLQARFQSGSIHLKKNPTDDTDNLIDELIRFPVGRWDDLADASQYQVDIAYAPNEPLTGGDAEESFPRSRY